MLVPFTVGSLCRKKNDSPSVNPNTGAGLTVASVYSKAVIIDFINMKIQEIRELLFCSEQEDGKLIFTSEIINSSSFNSSYYPDVVNFLRNYIDYNVELRRFSFVFSGFISLELPFKQIDIPLNDCNLTDFSSYLLYKDSIIRKEYKSHSITSGLQPYGSVNEGYYNALFCVTFHYDKNTDKSFVCIYFPSTYSNNVQYLVYVIDINKKYTNCCLKKCFEPTKYILI